MAAYKTYTESVNAGTPVQTVSINGDLPTVHRLCVSVVTGTSVKVSFSMLDPAVWGDDLLVPSLVPFETSLGVKHVRITRDTADATCQIFAKG